MTKTISRVSKFFAPKMVSSLFWLVSLSLSFVFCAEIFPSQRALAEISGRGFDTPSALQGRVDFWIAIFTKYGKNHRVFHHRDYPEIIYSIIDFSDLEANLEGKQLKARKLKEANAELDRIRSSLKHLGSGKEPRDEFENRIVERFHILPGDARRNYRKAAEDKNIRYQRGIKERFRDGLVRAGRYLPAIESIMEEEGLPAEIGRLPLVESSFDYEAYSSVGAAGIWQFMRSTGKRFMRIDASIDERRDPIIATRAAAKYLKNAYDHFGYWSLALTSYNHGVGGVNKAVKSTGTKDIVKIIRNYKGRTFGFASSNFYVEFLAALEVESNSEKYFPGLVREDQWFFDEVVLGKTIRFSELVKYSGVSRDNIEKLNLAFKSSILNGRVGIVKGTVVKVPFGVGDAVIARVAGSRKHTLKAGLLPVPKYVAKRRSSSTSAKSHRVRKGQTAGSIARRYRVSLKSLLRANGIKNANKIRIGQKLKIPSGSVSSSKSRKKVRKHKIRSGDSLSVIARKYSVSMRVLAKRNNLKKPYNLRKGAVLVIP